MQEVAVGLVDYGECVTGYSLKGVIARISLEDDGGGIGNGLAGFGVLLQCDGRGVLGDCDVGGDALRYQGSIGQAGGGISDGGDIDGGRRVSRLAVEQ